YNNARTLKRVLEEVLAYTGPYRHRTIVINDGATDATTEILEAYKERVIVLENSRNRGRGYSLRRGFREAIERGCGNAVSVDSDGRHCADDMPAFVKAALEQPGTLIMGSRNMDQEEVPGRSSFGNKFSSFWFRFHT